MDDFQALNPGLYGKLCEKFGKVKVQNPGQRMIRRATDQFVYEIASKGETYMVCCPWCGDSKFKLYVNYMFGVEESTVYTIDPSGVEIPTLFGLDQENSYDVRLYLNICHRCGPKTDQLRELIEWTSLPRHAMPDGEEFPGYEQEAVYVSPGTCVCLDDPRAKAGWDYLAGRGIDPLEATNVYGVTFCVEGNKDMLVSMAGRLIFSVTKDWKHVGWQARLAFEPNVFDKDRNFKNLRWYTSPGKWRSRYLLGYDQAKFSRTAILVEGPTDMIMQGPPCIASLGQGLSYGQVRLMKETWNRIIVVGDRQSSVKTEPGSPTTHNVMKDHKKDGEEDRMQRITMGMLSREDFDGVHLVKLPYGDPGSMPRDEFIQVVTEQVMASPEGEGGDSTNIGEAFGHEF